MQLSYQTTGDPKNPPLVLLMGLGLPAAAWPPEFLERLAAGGCWVIAPDNRDSRAELSVPMSVGRLSLLANIAAALVYFPVHGAYEIEDMAVDVARMLDGMGIERAHLAGISLGGMIAQSFAGCFPARTLSLTSISSASGNPATGRGSWKAIRELLKEKPAAETEAQCAQRMKELLAVIGSRDAGHTDASILETVRRIRSVPACEGGAARQLLAILESGSRVEQLTRVKSPTLVIHGDADCLIPPAAGREVAREIPGAQFVSVPGMGHDLAPAYVGRIADEMLRFLRAHS